MFNSKSIKKPTVAVVIPIYKSELSYYESISLRQCLQTLGAYTIVVIAPEGLSWSIRELQTDNNVKVLYFAQKYFTSTSSYSKLMLMPCFYSRFLKYKYILIYQLDAFVFSDKLLEWCKLDYDYVGAPWINADWVKFPHWVKYFDSIKSTRLRTSSNVMRLVGNGGFSLRKVRSFLFASILLYFKSASWSQNEDVFWSFEVPRYIPFFKIPNEEDAVKFSFETNPKQCFEKNNHRLPFGCHAWEKHDMEFWKPIFKTFGYEI